MESGVQSIELDKYYERMDDDIKSKFDEIIKKEPEYLKELDNIVTEDPEFLNMSDLFRQLIDTKYQMLIKGETDKKRAEDIAQDNEAKKSLESLESRLKAELEKAFTNGVLIKKCDGGSNPMFGNTKKDCCDSICEKIDNLVKTLEKILRYSLENKTIAEVAPSLTGRFTVGDKKSNIFNYFEDCKTEGKIDEKKYQRVKSNIEKLKNFLGIQSQQGGYSKNRYNRTTSTRKKSRKSRGRGRRHRRSSHNKKRHTKRHTKRYRKRK